MDGTPTGVQELTTSPTQKSVPLESETPMGIVPTGPAAAANRKYSAFEEHFRSSGDPYSRATWQTVSGENIYGSWLSTEADGNRKKETYIDALVATKDIEGARAYMPNIDTIGKIANELKTQAKLSGVDFNNKAKDANWHTLRLAQSLADAGVGSIKDLRQKNGKWVDKNGKVVFSGDVVGASAQGDGWTDYKVTPDAQGRPVFYGSWESSSDKGKIAAGLGLVLNLVAPGAGTALGNAVGLTGGVATAVGGGIIQGGLAAAGGASGEGILRSALSAGAAPILSAVPGFSALPALTKKVIAGAASGAIKSDSSKGALLGAVTGSVPGNMTGNATIDRLLKAILSNQVQKKVMKP